MPIIKEERLTGFVTNLDGLKDEVQNASQADWKYSMVDEAKKRAVYTSRNYDEFKSLVQGCTLKPIHRHEFNEPPAFQYNYAAKDKGMDSTVGNCDAKLSIDFRMPRNGSEFEREFSRAEDKIGWLQQIPMDNLATIFKLELDVVVFTKLIAVLHTAEDQDFAKEFVRRLRGSSMDFARNFLNNEEKLLLADLEV